jgi:hypothetical protein
MKKKKFKAEVVSGHKEAAVEVPFNPEQAWGIPPKPLWRGWRGHSVNATVNGFLFESSIVPRQKKFYMTIDAEAAKSAGVAAGDVVEVALQPSDHRQA